MKARSTKPEAPRAPAAAFDISDEERAAFRKANRQRVEHMTSACSEIALAEAALELALIGVRESGIQHPLLTELRDALVDLRRMHLHATQILRRIP